MIPLKLRTEVRDTYQSGDVVRFYRPISLIWFHLYPGRLIPKRLRVEHTGVIKGCTGGRYHVYVYDTSGSYLNSYHIPASDVICKTHPADTEAAAAHNLHEAVG